MRKVVSLLLIMALMSSMAVLTGCAKSSSTTQSDSSGATSSAGNPDANKPVGYQLDKPEKGEEIAVMTTSMGVVKLRFFPNAAPKAVENFKGLIKKGYYNGLIFHRVIKDFMIQSGDPTGTGSGGESIWGKAFEDEVNANLLNIRGAVAMANSGPNTNGSQFFINQANKSTFKGWDYYGQQMDMTKVTDAVKKLYTENGGNPVLDGVYSLDKTAYTVFAQAFEGLDVVDKIASVPTGTDPNNSNIQNKPITAVTITKIELVKYQ